MTTIVSFTTVYLNPGVKLEDVHKLIKRGADLARKHGAGNVAVTVTRVEGPATNMIEVRSSGEDWGRFGDIERALLDDPDMQALLQEAGQIATWESYVSQAEVPNHSSQASGKSA